MQRPEAIHVDGRKTYTVSILARGPQGCRPAEQPSSNMALPFRWADQPEDFVRLQQPRASTQHHQKLLG